PGTTSLGPFHPQRPGDWWTGEDSNLRSPQGAADLQSAGFSHSPTRPANYAEHNKRAPNGEIRNAEKALVQRHHPQPLFPQGTRPPQSENSRPFKFSWRRDLNPRPSDYKSDALPTELRQPAQTQQSYHTGNAIASGFALRARTLPGREIGHVLLPSPYSAADGGLANFASSTGTL